MYPQLVRHIFFPVLDAARGTNTMKYLKCLEKSQWLSPPELRALQEKNLRALVSHAVQNVPYYTKLMKNIGVTTTDIHNAADLAKIPMLTKATINAHLSDMLSIESSQQRHRPIPYSTGGSTGQPLHFYVTREMSSWGSAASHRALGWAGLIPGKRHAILWGSSFDTSFHTTFRANFKDRINRRLMMNSFELSDAKLAEFASTLQSYKPDFIKGYASAVHLLAKYIKTHGIKGIAPRGIITSAENLFDHQRKDISEVFQCPVFDAYSGRETSAVACECEQHCGYHTSVETAVFEVVKDGEPAAAGEKGVLLLTDLHNYAMPFIRYEVGDLATVTDEKCPCGRGLPMLKSIDGRIHDLIVTADGKYIPGEFFPHLVKDVQGIEEYQFWQRRRGEVTLKIKKGEGYTEEALAYVLKNIAQYGELDVKVEYVDSIPVPPSGKRRFTISEVAVDFK